MWLSSWVRARWVLGVGVGVLAGCGDGEDSTVVPAPPTPGDTQPDASQDPGNPPRTDGGGAPNVTDGGGEAPIPQPTLDAGLLECAGPSGPAVALQLTPVATGLESPTYVATAPSDDSRLFVLEQPGLIRVVRDGQLLPEPFLDLTVQVIQYASEDGVVGLVFHPDYVNNGRFFVHYITEQVGVDPAAPADAGGDAGDGGSPDPTSDAGLFIPAGSSVISEFRVSSDADRAIADSERRLLVVEQPFTNHNGGMLAISPADGMLYLGMGDGGSAGDPTGVAQNLSKLTGKMLRIDVDGSTDGLPYGIPEGNMTGAGVRPEVWAYGYRNPWRYSFDPCNGDLYVGDVGQYAMEEVDYEPANSGGRNYGWNIMEGSMCYDQSVACDPSGTVLPIAEYAHALGCAVISGYVYRGQNIPSLRGTYLYADYCRGTFWSLRMQGGVATEQKDITADLNPTSIPNITSFGVDNHGEIYVVAREGTIYRIDPE
jgi:glucose/arabinose dehydrogenase